MTSKGDGGGRKLCGGQLRQSEGACEKTAGWGTDHVGIGRCRLHGGNTPSHQRAAQLEQARRDVATYGLPREVAPDVALLEEVHRSAGHVAYLASRVAELGQDEVVWG